MSFPADSRRCCRPHHNVLIGIMASCIFLLDRSVRSCHLMLMDLLAEMSKSVAQWNARDLNQPPERRVQLQDQEDRA